MDNIYNIPLKKINGEEVNLEQYKGKVLLIVNTASKCGFTPQFEGLESLYKEYQDKGLVILGFPSNQFLHQDPGTNDEISEFCSLNYGVTFPMFAKIDVNGADTHPLYAKLKKSAKGLMGSENVKWNFTKFLVNKEGDVVKRFPPTTEPAKLAPIIQQLLDS
ncbi:glutathione peroxidase [Alkalimarinus sediminis]|uniref:Glutathione peroxidase n=1 Tax=Alkalimarinus sediminis TaxID=1632866 RepID=A0A9E8HPL4_9ALTE|nr:glutathione peroxidase [Alkalimarinus sediminis]UZW76413.1 glutathione peroxidase [Alkalimarinus sediminis]